VPLTAQQEADLLAEEEGNEPGEISQGHAGGGSEVSESDGDDEAEGHEDQAVSEEEEEVAIDPVSAPLLAGDNVQVVALVGKATVPMEEVPTSPERRFRSGESDQLPKQTSPEQATLGTGLVRKVEVESAEVDLVVSPEARLPSLPKLGKAAGKGYRHPRG